jgi:RNA polymerase sigma factor (sigma-70 family)
MDNADIVDDIVQETLTRLLDARWRLDRAALVAYALVTARNLVAEHQRTAAVAQRHAPRLAEPVTSASADDAVLAAEEQAAMSAAVQLLDEPDRALLLAREVDEISVAKLAAEHGVTPQALTARLARARARLRVEHLLVFRRAAPRSPQCRPVLEALSLGDRRRQATLHAGAHLLRCRTCGPLAEPLLRRRRSLSAFWPVSLLAAPWRSLRAHAGSAGTAAGAVVVAVGVLVAVLVVRADGPPPAPPPGPPPNVERATGPLTVAGEPLPFSSVRTLRSRVGEPVRAQRARVLSVPADEGFWIGTASEGRVWVQLRGGGESRPRIAAGRLVSFTGRVASAPASMPGRVGLSSAEGAAELVDTGAYIEVRTGDVTTE